MKSFFQWLLVVAFLAILVFVPVNKKNNEVLPQEDLRTTDGIIKQVKIGKSIVEVEVVATPESQERGLSGRSTLSPEAGMLFVFDHPGIYPFWMKDMNFPIDIIWIAEDMSIVYIKKNALPESYPNSFMPERNSLYVLETVSGFSDQNELKVGDRAEFVF